MTLGGYYAKLYPRNFKPNSLRKLYFPERNIMRISYKLISLVLCAAVSISFAAAKPAKEAPMKVKTSTGSVQGDTNAPAQKAEAVKPVPAEPAKPAAAPEMKKQEAPKAEGSDTAVTVNGAVITEADIDARLKPMIDRMAGRMDPNMIEQRKKMMRDRMLEAMISEKILDEQVKKNNITVTDSDVNDKITEMIKPQGITPDMLRSILAQQGRTYEQLFDQVKKEIGYEKLFEAKAGPVEINDAEAKAYYEENKDNYNQPEQVKASHILIKVAPSATTEEKAAAKEKAEKLLKQVKEGGDFAQLAKDNSDCPSKAKGGDLGYFDRTTMVKEFSDAAFAMKVGQVSDVVETQFGYHIIKVTDHKNAGMTSFDEVKDEITKGLKQQKLAVASKEYLDKLKAESKIVYPEGKEPKPMPMMPMEMRAAPAPASTPPPPAPPK